MEGSFPRGLGAKPLQAGHREAQRSPGRSRSLRPSAREQGAAFAEPPSPTGGTHAEPRYKSAAWGHRGSATALSTGLYPAELKGSRQARESRTSERGRALQPLGWWCQWGGQEPGARAHPHPGIHGRSHPHGCGDKTQPPSARRGQCHLSGPQPPSELEAAGGAHVTREVQPRAAEGTVGGQGGSSRTAQRGPPGLPSSNKLANEGAPGLGGLGLATPWRRGVWV